MGQFGNQPDFATNDIKQINPSDNINQSTFLNGSVIYIGDNSAGGDMVVIPAGAVGQSTVTDLVSPGYSGSNGTGYTPNPAGTATTTTTGSGTGLTLKTKVLSGAITEISIGTSAGTDYLNADLITVTGGDGNAVFRIVAAPGPPTGKEGVFFKGLQAGGFLPVTVDYVLATKGLPPTQQVTTVDSLIAAR